MKLAMIGAGSFVFGPSVLSHALLEHRLAGVELALVDVDAEMVEAMAAISRRLAAEQNLKSTVTAHTNRRRALEGADFVINAAAPEINRRYAMDCEVVDRLIPGHLVTEFGGVAGISYSLRQIAFVERLAADMRELCPDAWLLDAANPLPRVCQAAHELGIRTAGFCSVSLESYAMAWRALTGEQIHFPFAAAREALDLTMAGLNHFTWLVRAIDRRTGNEITNQIAKRIAAGATTGHPIADRMTLETGHMLAPNDNHTRDFLPPSANTPPRQAPSHGSGVDRSFRLTLLRSVAIGDSPMDVLLEHPAWERPVDFAVASAGGQPAEFHSLNLANTGQIPALPNGVFVETPRRVTSAGPEPVRVELPGSVLPHLRQTAEVTDLIVRGAMNRDLNPLREAVEMDPTILDKAAGFAALRECIIVHRDLLPEYR